jgi:hypothetical protein
MANSVEQYQQRITFFEKSSETKNKITELTTSKDNKTTSRPISTAFQSTNKVGCSCVSSFKSSFVNLILFSLMIPIAIAEFIK